MAPQLLNEKMVKRSQWKLFIKFDRLKTGEKSRGTDDKNVVGSKIRNFNSIVLLSQQEERVIFSNLLF
jgi:hypothetical protein